MVGHDIVKYLAHSTLGHGEARPLRIGAVAHQGQYALLADLAEALQIDGVAEYRRVIHLEVSGVHDDACRRIDRQRGRVHDTVVGLDELDPEGTQVDGLAVLNHLSLHMVQHVVLLQLVLNQADGQLGGVNRYVDILQYIGQRADMILVSMGDDKALYLLNVLLQIAHIRDNQVDTQHVVLGK